MKVSAEARTVVEEFRAVVAAMRRRTLVVALAIVLVPMVLLGVRWAAPSLGQIPFGWQMHTSCWGNPGKVDCTP